MRRHPFKIDAIAILPGVIHTLWTLPPDDADFAKRWRMIKSLFTKRTPLPQSEDSRHPTRNVKRVWQPHLWDHLIRDKQDLERHMKLIHASPVQAGLCANPSEWPHSSVHRQTQDSQNQSDIPACLPVKPLLARTYREEGFAHHP
jgi:putative transposase